MPQIVFQPSKDNLSAGAEIENLQTTLASLNQRILILQETLEEKDQEIAELKSKLAEADLKAEGSQTTSGRLKTDDTLSIVGAAVKLFKFITLARKDLS